jgi:protein-disulfide isomerase
MTLQAGVRIANKYRIERLLGQGGMGAVYVAENERLRKRVALKVLSDGEFAAEAMDRFVREAIAASSVKHPGVVEIYDADVHEGTHWIAMELLEGESLREKIERGPLEPDEAIEIALEALSAIAAVHRAGIIHRDLKPDNLFLERVGAKSVVKVLDFGIAKIFDGELGTTTKTGMALGTPYFLAPEQATNAKTIDVRADVYSMGAILYQCLSGKLPYDADTFGELVRQMYTTGPRQLEHAAPHVPRPIAQLVDRALSIDPAHRPMTADDLASQLSRAREDAKRGTPRTAAMEAVPAAIAGSAWTPPIPQDTHGGFGSKPVPATFGGISSGPIGAPPKGPPPEWGSPQQSSGGGGGLALAAVGIVVLLGVLLVGGGAGVALWLLRPRPGPDPVPVVTVQPPPVLGGNSATTGLGLPGSDAARVRVEVPATAPQRGPDDALVTIVMFSDYQCPFCSRVEPTLTRLSADYGQDLRIVWRDNPLPFHENAMPAAELAREAYAQGGDAAYWRMHDTLFEHQTSLSRESLEQYATSAGLDLTRVRAALDSHTHRAVIQADQTATNGHGARGTPAFFINGRNLMGAQPYESFDTVVREELAIARALVARGTPRSQVYASLIANAQASITEERPDPPTPARRQPDPNAIYRVPIGDSPALGPQDALVTIVTFSEFQCPFCARVQPTLERIREHYGDDVRIVFKHNPLPFHDHAQPAAEAAVEVYTERGADTFWRYHDRLFENSQNLSNENLDAWAREMGVRSVSAALADHRHRTRVSDDQQLAQGLGASGTPSFFINGRNLRGAQPFEAFQAVIDQELTRARSAIAMGTPRAQVYEMLIRDGHTTPQFLPDPAPSPAPNPSQPSADADRVYQIPVPTRAPSRGPQNAPVTIQIFSDFQCPFCVRARPTIDQLLADHPRDVRVVWRNYPLPFHQNAQPAAEAAMEVFAQRGDQAFWRYHDRLFENSQDLTRENLERFAAELGGIDMARFRSALDDRRHRASVQADMDAITNAGARIGTPSFFVNGRLIQGAQPLPAFETAVQRALAER